MRLDEFWRHSSRLIFGGSLAIGRNAALTRLDSKQKRRLRAEQIGAILALTPVMVICNLTNVAIVDYLFRNAGRGVFLAAWTGVIVLGVAVWVWQAMLRPAARAPREGASMRGVRRLTLNALVFGLVWGAPVVFLFDAVGMGERIVLFSIAAGMICGGAIALATIWQAALAYTIAMALPTAITLLRTGDPIYLSLLGLTASYTLLVGRAVYERAKLFTSNSIAIMALQEQKAGIAELLSDFEDSASNFLWETNSSGFLSRASDRFVGLLHKSREEVARLGLAKLFVAPANEANCLDHVLAAGKSFQDVRVSAMAHGEQREWSLSAKPIFDAEGQFAGFRGVGADITDNTRARAAIDRMANFDSLTGLPNRAMLQRHVEQALGRLRADGKGACLLSLDLDRFKAVNDTLGHLFGDSLLREVARRLTACLGREDFIARFGGDEFVILLDTPSHEVASLCARRIIERISAPYRLESHQVIIGASIGIAVAPQNGEVFDDLLRNSDLALYCAKSEGKGRYSFFSPEIGAAMQERRRMEIDMRAALARGEYSLNYQPLFDMHSGRVIGCEALLRWTHPERGAVAPLDFIPLAEETGFIVPLGEWILRAACVEAATWPRETRLMVNVSAAQFRVENFVEMVADALERANLAPHRLEIEITESLLITDAKSAIATLTRLRETGVRVSLDDFGTGYSSLAYLAQFPFDTIKIDRSFILDMAARPNCGAIIRAITALADALGMTTVAEGVETSAQLEQLRDFGCDCVQGYLFSAPVGPKDIGYLLGAPQRQSEAEIVQLAG